MALCRYFFLRHRMCVVHLRHRSHRRSNPSRRNGAIALVLFGCLVSSIALAQSSTAARSSTARRSPPTHSTAPTERRSSPAALELQARIDRAGAAQKSGDPNLIVAANQSLIGLALRRMGGLRLYQGALPDAA